MLVPYRQEYAVSMHKGVCEFHTGGSMLVTDMQEYAGSIQAGVLVSRMKEYASSI